MTLITACSWPTDVLLFIFTFDAQKVQEVQNSILLPNKIKITNVHACKCAHTHTPPIKGEKRKATPQFK
jgi:hypothetical protein